MKRFKRFFWFGAGILSPVPALVFYFQGNFYDILEPYSLGMIFGIIGYVYFANVLIVSARIRYFDRIFGHDRVMQYHGFTAFIALVFAVIHRQLKALVFTDFSSFQPMSGQIALLIFLFVIGLTLLFMVPGILHRLKVVDGLRIFVTQKAGLDYNILKGIHNLTAGAFALLIVHVLYASSTQENWGRMLLVAVWGATAVGLWGYHWLIRPLVLGARRLSVSSVIRHNDTVAEVRMSPHSSGLPRYKAGQFFFVRFPGSAVGGEEHPFTISSEPDQGFVSVTVKNLGNYSGRIHLLKEGDTVLLDGPYGVFSLDPQEKGPFLFIAGGIGITPFYSIMKGIQRDDPRAFFLFWAVRKREDLVYDAEFREMAGGLRNFHYIPVLSDEEPRNSEEKGFVTAGLLRKYFNTLPSCTVCFCGPPVMRQAVFKVLRNEGVARKNIRYEMFSLG